MSKLDPSLEDVFAARVGDRAAQARVMAAMERLCWWLARKRFRHLPASMSLEDAVQDCRIGVLDAIRLYDDSHGANFATYAMQWMRARLGKSIDLEFAGAAPKVTGRSGGFLVRPTVGLERSALEPKEAAPIDLLGVDSEEALLDAVQAQQVIRLLERLPERQRLAIRARMAGQMLDEIAGQLGVSRERARQIIEEGVRGLRGALRMETPRVKRGQLPRQHGSRSMYGHGCRCLPCTRANAAYQLKRRHRYAAQGLAA